MDYRAARAIIPAGTRLVEDESEPGMLIDKPFKFRWEATRLAKHLEVLGYEVSVATVTISEQESWLYVRIPR